MTVAQLRRDLKKRIDQLPGSRLESAADYLGYLEESSHPTAAAMMARIRRSEEEIAHGQVTPISKLRRKY